ncbi:hypothetical protein SAMN04487970_101799 [Paenibacillus tianmuensis]|uniref:Flagellar protein FliT n=1 Tax=Paenibacillus tianmuensis TaxID=624147 RepID=A0A1G4RNQ2_9BACL|nr:hypothetical protein [Paenibacillus tianmuensis]SCW58603.1 hypothetical protein SAMN04487970_101799 [Paenibacillus tianmuensis]
MKEWSRLEEVFLQLKSNSKQMAILDLQNEDDVERLEELQLQQADLRTLASDLRLEISKVDLPKELLSLINECLEEERAFVDRLYRLRMEYSNKIQEFRNAAITKQRYESNYSQTEGFFVDRQR